MDLNDFMDTGKKKDRFKVTVINGKQQIKIYVNAYDKSKAKTEAEKRFGADHPELNLKSMKIEPMKKAVA